MTILYTFCAACIDLNLFHHFLLVITSFFTFFMMNFVTVGGCPPQLHIKPALDVQKMENIQTCLDFLEHYGVSVNGITADGKFNIFSARI